jgi:hypothetical protein
VYSNSIRASLPTEPKLANGLFRQEWYDLTSSTGRDISGMELKVPEGVYGSGQPIAEITFDNYLKSEDPADFGALAKIVPLVRKESDYREWEVNGTYTNNSNEAGKAGEDDASSDAPELIPANNNYGIYMSDNGTKAFLYRKTPFNYDEWIGGSNDLFTKNSFFGAAGAFHELVSVRVKYEIPTSEGTTDEARTQDRTINFYVKPVDRVELDWKKQFTFNVDETAASVDVTDILCAQMHNGDKLVKDDDIKYFIAGYIDESGFFMHIYYTGFINVTSNKVFNIIILDKFITIVHLST